MKDSEKAELERLARLATQDPHGDAFWEEVDKILEEAEDDEDDLVKPRREKK